MELITAPKLYDCVDKNMFVFFSSSQNQIEGAWFKHNAEESMFSSRLQGNGSKLLNSEGTSDYSCPWIPDVREWCCALHIHVTLYSAYKKKQTIS